MRGEFALNQVRKTTLNHTCLASRQGRHINTEKCTYGNRNVFIYDAPRGAKYL
jgi:hypothetical protein